MSVLIATSTNDFDPTEVSVPWKALTRAGINVVFATDTGTLQGADLRMLNGQGLGLFRPFLVAQASAQTLYDQMRDDQAYQNPIRYEDIHVGDYEALLLPGGHAKGIIPYLDSDVLHRAIAAFFAANKPIGAICHGVVAACRARDSKTGLSVLNGRKTTALLAKQERLAYHLTRRNLGDYYLTYPVTVEAEVTACLRTPTDFIQGPMPMLRDAPRHLNRGFTVRDGNYLSARWPGDAYRFAADFLDMLDGSNAAP